MNEQARRARALEELRLLEERIGDCNCDLTDEEIEELTVRADREVNRKLHEEWVAGSHVSETHPT